MAVRRLHDINRSGWWMLIQFTGVGIPLLVIFQLWRGKKGPNRFGPDPLVGA